MKDPPQHSLIHISESKKPVVSQEHWSSKVDRSLPSSPDDTLSRMTIRLLDGRNLLPSDLQIGSSNPVCFMWCCSDEKGELHMDELDREEGARAEDSANSRVQRSSVCHGTCNPHWDYEIIFPLAFAALEDLLKVKLKVVVRDERQRNNFETVYTDLGCLTISFQDIIEKGKLHRDCFALVSRWIPLQKAHGMAKVSGDLHISLFLTIKGIDPMDVHSGNPVALQKFQQGVRGRNAEHLRTRSEPSALGGCSSLSRHRKWHTLTSSTAPLSLDGKSGQQPASSWRNDFKSLRGPSSDGVPAGWTRGEHLDPNFPRKSKRSQVPMTDPNTVQPIPQAAMNWEAAFEMSSSCQSTEPEPCDSTRQPLADQPRMAAYSTVLPQHRQPSATLMAEGNLSVADLDGDTVQQMLPDPHYQTQLSSMPYMRTCPDSAIPGVLKLASSNAAYMNSQSTYLSLPALAETASSSRLAGSAGPPAAHLQQSHRSDPPLPHPRSAAAPASVKAVEASIRSRSRFQAVGTQTELPAWTAQHSSISQLHRGWTEPMLSTDVDPRFLYNRAIPTSDFNGSFPWPEPAAAQSSRTRMLVEEHDCFNSNGPSTTGVHDHHKGGGSPSRKQKPTLHHRKLSRMRLASHRALQTTAKADKRLHTQGRSSTDLSWRQQILQSLARLECRETLASAKMELRGMCEGLSGAQVTLLINRICKMADIKTVPARIFLLQLLCRIVRDHSQAAGRNIEHLVAFLINRVHDFASVLTEPCVAFATAIAVYVIPLIPLGPPAEEGSQAEVDFPRLLSPLILAMSEQDMHVQERSGMCIAAMMHPTLLPFTVHVHTQCETLEAAIRQLSFHRQKLTKDQLIALPRPINDSMLLLADGQLMLDFATVKDANSFYSIYMNPMSAIRPLPADWMVDNTVHSSATRMNHHLSGYTKCLAGFSPRFLHVILTMMQNRTILKRPHFHAVRNLIQTAAIHTLHSDTFEEILNLAALPVAERAISCLRESWDSAGRDGHSQQWKERVAAAEAVAALTQCRACKSAIRELQPVFLAALGAARSDPIRPVRQACIEAERCLKILDQGPDSGSSKWPDTRDKDPPLHNVITYQQKQIYNCPTQGKVAAAAEQGPEHDGSYNEQPFNPAQLLSQRGDDDTTHQAIPSVPNNPAAALSKKQKAPAAASSTFNKLNDHVLSSNTGMQQYFSKLSQNAKDNLRALASHMDNLQPRQHEAQDNIGDRPISPFVTSAPPATRARQGVQIAESRSSLHVIQHTTQIDSSAAAELDPQRFDVVGAGVPSIGQEENWHIPLERSEVLRSSDSPRSQPYTAVEPSKYEEASIQRDFAQRGQSEIAHGAHSRDGHQAAAADNAGSKDAFISANTISFQATTPSASSSEDSRWSGIQLAADVHNRLSRSKLLHAPGQMQIEGPVTLPSRPLLPGDDSPQLTLSKSTRTPTTGKGPVPASATQQPASSEDLLSAPLGSSTAAASCSSQIRSRPATANPPAPSNTGSNSCNRPYSARSRSSPEVFRQPLDLWIHACHLLDQGYVSHAYETILEAGRMCELLGILAKTGMCAAQLQPEVRILLFQRLANMLPSVRHGEPGTVLGDYIVPWVLKAVKTGDALQLPRSVRWQLAKALSHVLSAL